LQQNSAQGQPEAAPWIVRLLRWARPAEGWLILTLAWVAVCCLPAAAIEGDLIPGLEPTLWLTTLGLLVGRWLARGRLRGLAAAPIALLAGALADLIWGVHVLGVWPLFAQGGRWLAWWLRCAASETCLLPAPLFTYPAEQGARLAGFGQRVGWWVNGLFTGQGVADNLVLIAFVGLLAWLVAAWAGWWLTRPKSEIGNPQSFVALLPTGVLLAQQVYWANAGYTWLLVFLAAVTLLLTLGHYHRLTQEWEATGADYSPELRLGAGAAGLALAGLALILAPTLPFLTSREVQDAFWRIFEQPYRQVEERMGQSFSGVQGGRSLVPPTGVAAGGLPRAHLLGGRPELGREIALRVRVRGAKPDDAFYWRGQTFAYYTGRGWENKTQRMETDPTVTGLRKRIEAGQVQGDFIRLNLGAGESWTTDQPVGRRPVLSSVEVLAASRAVLYTAGEPISADQPYQAILRAPGELVALQIPGAPDRYTVLGALADQDPDALRAAGTDYPPEIAALYLQLPADLPADLATFAAQIVPLGPVSDPALGPVSDLALGPVSDLALGPVSDPALGPVSDLALGPVSDPALGPVSDLALGPVSDRAPSPYDTALAIEAALRQIPYSLDVPPPPAGREVVSWFLFDLRRGYCDYFATTMVVLARLNGIPARLAVGYAGGNYDPRFDRYEVTELQAHSWPELYFPGYGWIPFEPTPAQPLPTRLAGTRPAQPNLPQPAGPETLDAGLAELRGLATAQAATTARRTWAQGVLAGLNGLLACWLASWLLWLRSSAAGAGATSEYVRLARWGARLGRPPQAGDTAREYAAAVVQTAAQIAARRGPARVARAAAIVQAEAPRLAQAFELACYGPEPAGHPPRKEEGQRWRPLWAALRRLWLSRWRI
jgi:transglutaminase-like putative cysteine protease